MTELDAYNALTLANEQVMNIGDTLITLLTGYLLISFFVGEKLTTFQVCFVTAVFLMTYVSTWATYIDYIGTTNYLREALADLQSELPLAGGTFNSTATFSIIVAFLLTIGALYFMWSVRHPKTE